MFTEIPRYIGFPNQIWCETEFAFKNFEVMFKGKAPFFVSPFGYKDKNTPIVDNLFFDIDSYYSVRFPWRNVNRLKNWAERNNYPYIINFSGGKGFHFFLLIKPIIPKTPKEIVRLADLMYSVQMRIVEELGLEAYDEPTFGRIRFLVRYPTSKYIRKNDETGVFEQNGLYCRNLTPKEFDAGVKKIFSYAKEPGIIPVVKKSDVRLQKIASKFKNFKIVPRKVNKGIKLEIERKGTSVPTIQALGLPCLQKIAGRSHPTHFERVELVAWMKHLGYTDLAINAFIKNRQWTRYKYAITSYQVRTVKPRQVKCSFLKKTYEEECKKCPLKR